MPCDLRREAVAIVPGIADKEEALARTVELACGAHGLDCAGDILSSVLERENMLSTGIGLGIAVPHCRSSEVETIVNAAMLIPEGIDYNSVDGQPVRLIYLIVSPKKDVEGHIACLSSLSRAVSDSETRQRLLGSGSADDLFAALDDAL